MNKAHTRIVWENYPSTETPINETNLNKMDSALDTIDDRVVAFDTTKANQSDLLQSLKNVTYNTQTGLFTFTWWNGATKTVDLNIEKIPVSFSMSAAGVITMTNTDGTKYAADVSTLIKAYTFSTSSDIRFNTVTDASGNKTITAFIVDGSVTEDKLQPNFLANCRAQVTAATTQATKAQSYAVGGTGTRTGEDTDNAKYYYEQTQAISPAYDGIAAITDTTAPLTLANSARGKANLTRIQGRMEQGTTTGKNLLPMTVEGIKAANTVGTWSGNIYTYNSVTFEVLTDDGVKVNGIKLNGKASDNAYLVLDNNFDSDGLTGCVVNGLADTTKTNAAKFRVSNRSNFVAIQEVYNGTAIVSNGSALRFSLRIEIFYTANNLIVYPMIRLATETDPTFEPYTGGIPSPNPDFPQEIKKVTVSKVRATGKNLCPINDLNVSAAEVFVKIIIGGSKNICVSLRANRISGISITNNNIYGFRILEYNSKGTLIKTTNSNTKYIPYEITDSFFKTITTDPLCTYIMIDLGNYNADGNINTHKFDIQCEESSTATTYEPYHSTTVTLPTPIDLYGQGDIRDEIVRGDDGLFRVGRKYGKLVLDGSGSFALDTTQSDNYQLFTRLLDTYNGKALWNTIRSLGNQGLQSGGGVFYARGNYYGIDTNSKLFLSVDKSTASTVAELVSHLSNNPYEIIYELATPTTEVLSTADQIALNSIDTWDTVTYLELLDNEVEPKISGEYGISKVGGYALAAKQHEAITEAMYTVENGVLCAFVDYE